MVGQAVQGDRNVGQGAVCSLGVGRSDEEKLIYMEKHAKQGRRSKKRKWVILNCEAVTVNALRGSEGSLSEGPTPDQEGVARHLRGRRAHAVPVQRHQVLLALVPRAEFALRPC